MAVGSPVTVTPELEEVAAASLVTAPSPLAAASAPAPARRARLARVHLARVHLARVHLARALDDPRHLQLAVQLALITYGLLALDFDASPLQLAVTVVAALATQALATRVAGLPHLELRSALASGLSLCLLFRADHWAWGAVAAATSILGKFVVRSRGKHVFNPTCLGIVLLLATSDHVWVSPAQWGAGATLAYVLVYAAALVLRRSPRSDVTLAFLTFHAALLFGRALWLGDPLSIPVNQLANGMVLLFAFSMISDPATTPDARLGRVLFALAVALGAYFVRFELYANNGLLWSLAAASLTVRALDHLFPGTRHAWRTGAPSGAPPA